MRPVSPSGAANAPVPPNRPGRTLCSPRGCYELGRGSRGRRERPPPRRRRRRGARHGTPRRPPPATRSVDRDLPSIRHRWTRVRPGPVVLLPRRSSRRPSSSGAYRIPETVGSPWSASEGTNGGATYRLSGPASDGRTHLITWVLARRLRTRPLLWCGQDETASSASDGLATVCSGHCHRAGSAGIVQHCAGPGDSGQRRVDPSRRPGHTSGWSSPLCSEHDGPSSRERSHEHAAAS